MPPRVTSGVSSGDSTTVALPSEAASQRCTAYQSRQAELCWSLSGSVMASGYSSHNPPLAGSNAKGNAI